MITDAQGNVLAPKDQVRTAVARRRSEYPGTVVKVNKRTVSVEWPGFERTAKVRGELLIKKV